jgi:hypothetical protein
MFEAATLEKIVNELLEVPGNKSFRDAIGALARELMRALRLIEKREPRWRRGAPLATWFCYARGRNGPRHLLVALRHDGSTPRLICNPERIRRMGMTGTALIAAAMLAGAMGIATAQTSTTTTSPSATSPGAMKCWDSVTKQVRNETPSTTGSTSNSSTGASGTSTTTSTPSTGAGSTSGTTRPAEAAGLPDCRH